MASPSETIWLFGHQQVSPGCTLSKETVAALLPKETFTCLQNTPTSTVNSIFQKFPHLLSILKHSQGKSTNQDQMYLLQQCWGGGGGRPSSEIAMVFNCLTMGQHPGMRGMLVSSSTLPAGMALWWLPGKLSQSCSTRRSMFLASPYHICLV